MMSSKSSESNIYKNVSFADTIDVIKIENSNSIDHVEKNKLFYSENDIREIRRSNEKTVRMINSTRIFQDNHSQSSRGLEGKTFIGRSKTNRLRYEGKEAVLFLQKRLFMDDVDDQEKIATAYSKVSLEAAEAARQLGEADQEFVRALILSESTQHEPVLTARRLASRMSFRLQPVKLLTIRT